MGIACENSRRRKRRQRLRNLLDLAEGNLVDSEIECFAHADIVHRRLRNIHDEISYGRFGRVHVILLRSDDVQPVIRHGVVGHGVYISNFVKVHDGRKILRRVKIHFVQMDVGGIPIKRIALDHHFVVRLPRLQFKRAASDDMRGIGPLVTVLFDGLSWSQAEKLMRHQRKKVRR